MIVESILSPDFPKTMGPYSQATRAGPFIFCAGQGGVDPSTGRLVSGGIREQTRQTIHNLQMILEAAGSDLTHVAMVTVLLHDWKYFEGMKCSKNISAGSLRQDLLSAASVGRRARLWR